MKLKIKKNFSFKKLQSKTLDIILKTTEDYASKTEEGSKQKINRGLRKLTDVTKAIRKERNQRPAPALKATGALLKSIKSKGSSLEMLFYGKLHNDGFTTGKGSMIPNVRIEPRPFISTTLKDKKKINAQFIKSIDKALKK
jgi:hypothetical protein